MVQPIVTQHAVYHNIYLTLNVVIFEISLVYFYVEIWIKIRHFTQAKFL